MYTYTLCSVSQGNRSGDKPKKDSKTVNDCMNSVTVADDKV